MAFTRCAAASVVFYSDNNINDPANEFEFSIRKEGASSYFGAMITDAATCAAAATALGFSDTTVTESTYSYAPAGCAYPSGYLYLYPATNTQSCSSTKNCLCSFVPPSPPSPPSPPAVPPSPPSYPPGVTNVVGGYYQLSSGSCGGSLITDQATCDAAAAALGLSDTTSSTSTATYYPPGCVVRYSSLYLYPVTNSYSCSSYEMCICASLPPPIRHNGISWRLSPLFLPAREL